MFAESKGDVGGVGRKNLKNIPVFVKNFSIRNVFKINYSFFLLNYNQSLRYFFVSTPSVAP